MILTLANDSDTGRLRTFECLRKIEVNKIPNYRLEAVSDPLLRT